MSDILHTYLPFVGQEINVLVLVGIGFSVGVLAGFFGMGGGWVVTPALYAVGFPFEAAVGTELANIAAQSSLATAKHGRKGNVDWRLGLVVGVCMMAGVELGKRVLNWLVAVTDGAAGSVVGWVYVVLLGSLGAYVLWESVRALRTHVLDVHDGVARGEVRERVGLVDRHRVLQLPPLMRLRGGGRKVSVPVLAGLGLVIGVMAGVMGVGGGVALVPAFVYVVGVSTRLAVGTSLLCVMLSGAYGAYAFGAQGNVEMVAVLWMLVGATVGTQLGVAAMGRVRGHGIRLLYGCMLLLAASGVVLAQLEVVPDADGNSRLAPVVILGGALLMCFVIIGFSAARGGSVSADR